MVFHRVVCCVVELKYGLGDICRNGTTAWLAQSPEDAPKLNILFGQTINTSVDIRCLLSLGEILIWPTGADLITFSLD